MSARVARDLPRPSTAAALVFAGLLLASTLATRPAVANELRIAHGVRTARDGQTVIVVHGTHRQRGEALGRLAGHEIMALVRDYGFTLVPPRMLTWLRGGFATVFHVPERYREEVEGILAGLEAAGVDTLLPDHGRKLDAVDLYVMLIVPDLGAMGCSSLSAWGDATRSDERLAGAPVLARNLDYTVTRGSVKAIRAAEAIVVHVPAEEDEHPWLSVGMLGFVGALSGFDASGRGAFLNINGSADAPSVLSLLGRGALPTALSVRESLERRDLDGDGRTSTDDVVWALRDRPRAGAVLVHTISKDEPRGRVVEVAPNEVAVRTPRKGATSVVATNHSRSLTAPSKCRRYGVLTEHLSEAGASVRAGVLPKWMDDVSFDGDGVRTIETMVWEPAAGRIGVAFLGADKAATDRALVWHEFSELKRLAR